MPRTNFGNGLLDVSLEAPDEITRHALGYFAPSGSTHAAEWTVRADRREPERLPEPSWTLARGEYAEPLLRSPDGRGTVSLVSGVRTDVDPEARVVTVTGAETRHLFMEAYRAVRQILVHSLLRRGAVVVHAGAVAARGEVTLFVGRKGAGKTTAVWQSLTKQPGDLDFVANDRVLLLPDAGGFHVFGWPATAFVGLGTVESTVGRRALATLHERAGGTAYLMTDHRLTSDPLARLLSAAPLSPALAAHKVYLLPGEIATAVSCRISSGGRLARIVFPTFQAGAYETAVRDVPPAEALERLAPEILGAELGYPDTLGFGTAWNTELSAAFRTGLDQVALVRVAGDELWRGLPDTCFSGVSPAER